MSDEEVQIRPKSQVRSHDAGTPPLQIAVRTSMASAWALVVVGSAIVAWNLLKGLSATGALAGCFGCYLVYGGYRTLRGPAELCFSMVADDRSVSWNDHGRPVIRVRYEDVLRASADESGAGERPAVQFELRDGTTAMMQSDYLMSYHVRTLRQYLQEHGHIEAWF